LQALPGFRYCIDILIEIRKLSTGHFRNGAPAKALGKNGGAARAKSMTPERCVEIAKSAAKKRQAELLHRSTQSIGGYPNSGCRRSCLRLLGPALRKSDNLRFKCGAWQPEAE
jgi:hypothetical protein